MPIVYHEGKKYSAQFVGDDVLLYSISTGDYVKTIFDARIAVEPDNHLPPSEKPFKVYSINNGKKDIVGTYKEENAMQVVNMLSIPAYAEQDGEIMFWNFEYNAIKPKEEPCES